MIRRIMQENPLHLEEMARMLRDRGRPVLIVSGYHGTAAHGRWHGEVLKEAQKVLGSLTVATECPDSPHYRNFFDSLGAMNDEEAFNAICKFAYETLFPEYYYGLLFHYRKLRKKGIPIIPIDVGPENDGYQQVVEYDEEVRKLIIGPTMGNFSREMPFMVEQLLAVTGRRDLVNPILAANMNRMLEKSDLPGALVIGGAHLEYVESEIKCGNIISLVGRHNIEGRMFERAAYEAALKEEKSSDDHVSIARSWLFDIAVCNGVYENLLESITKAKSICELKRIWNAMREAKRASQRSL